MGESTAIAWTDHTFNGWWGCERVSPACRFCYAESFAKRTGHDVWGKDSERRFFGDKHWAEPLKWNETARITGRPALVFCSSMADVFEDRHDLEEPRDRLFELIDDTPHLIWQLLTKRPQNVQRMVPWGWQPFAGGDEFPAGRVFIDWPANVWIGTTVEDQERADERLPILATIPAPVRFVSAEPLLGPVSLDPWLADGTLDWVIVGGESGPKHRPLDVNNARRIMNACGFHGVPAFFKQVGGRTPTAGGDTIDGQRVKQFPWQAMR